MSIRDNCKRQSDINLQLFYDMYMLRVALNSHKNHFKRGRKYNLDTIFQDLIAKYIRISIGSEYEIIIEHQFRNIRADIAIKKENKYHSIIEIKTVLGYGREKITRDNGYLKRLDQYHKMFKVPLERCFYVMESPANTNNNFRERIFSPMDDKIKNHIFPLFKKIADPNEAAKFCSVKNGKGFVPRLKPNQIKKYFNEINACNFKNILQKIVG